MRVINIIDEDFINYRKPAMFIGTVSCDGKCCLESGIPLSACQNDGWRNSASVYLTNTEICERYLANDLTSAIVIGGLEPIEQTEEVIRLIRVLREVYRCQDDVVIYTGYRRDEIEDELEQLEQFQNIIIKMGRYIPDSESRFDEVLGVSLSSSNQYAERIS